MDMTVESSSKIQIQSIKCVLAYGVQHCLAMKSRHDLDIPVLKWNHLENEGMNEPLTSILHNRFTSHPMKMLNLCKIAKASLEYIL